MEEEKRKKRMNVAAALMGLDVPAAEDSSEVGELLDEDRRRRERRAKLRKMKPWQRRKSERDAKRVKFTVRIPVPLAELVKEIARVEIASPSSAAAWLIAVGLGMWDEKRVPPPGIGRPRSLRVDTSLVIPDRWEGERVTRTFDLPQVAEGIRSLAGMFQCGVSDAVAWLMSVGADEYRKGRYPSREASNDIRYPFRLKMPRRRKRQENPEGMSPAETLRMFMSGK